MLWGRGSNRWNGRNKSCCCVHALRTKLQGKSGEADQQGGEAMDGPAVSRSLSANHYQGQPGGTHLRLQRQFAWGSTNYSQDILQVIAAQVNRFEVFPLSLMAAV